MCHSEQTMSDADVLMCFHFVRMSTLVLVESTQLLESIDLNPVPHPIVKDN